MTLNGGRVSNDTTCGEKMPTAIPDYGSYTRILTQTCQSWEAVVETLSRKIDRTSDGPTLFIRSKRSSNIKACQFSSPHGRSCVSPPGESLPQAFFHFGAIAATLVD